MFPQILRCHQEPFSTRQPPQRALGPSSLCRHSLGLSGLFLLSGLQLRTPSRGLGAATEPRPPCLRLFGSFCCPFPTALATAITPEGETGTSKGRTWRNLCLPGPRRHVSPWSGLDQAFGCLVEERNWRPWSKNGAERLATGVFTVTKPGPITFLGSRSHLSISAPVGGFEEMRK